MFTDNFPHPIPTPSYGVGDCLFSDILMAIKHHISLTVFFVGVTCAFVLLILIFTSNTYGTSAPTVDSVTASATSGGSETTLTLTENTTTALYAYGVITDADGCADVATNGTVTGKFYRTDHLNADSCSPDNNDCYTMTNAQCTKTGCDGPGDNVFNYECTAQIQYYADSTMTGPHTATNWTAKIAATDASTATGANTDTIEMNSTIALDIGSAITYGSLVLSAQSAEQTLTITNTGNTGIDVDTSAASDMTCSTGSIPVSAVHYSMAQGFAYASGTAVSTGSQELELNLANRTNDASASTKNVYFRLLVPASGAGGDCTNIVTITAKTDAENGW